MSSSTARLAAACESRSATKNGFPFQAGSLNRRSFGSNPAGTVSLSLSHWVRVRGGTCASATARCSPTLNTCNGSPAAWRTTRTRASPNCATSSGLDRAVDSGASTSAARMAISQGRLCHWPIMGARHRERSNIPLLGKLHPTLSYTACAAGAVDFRVVPTSGIAVTARLHHSQPPYDRQDTRPAAGRAGVELPHSHIGRWDASAVVEQRRRRRSRADLQRPGHAARRMARHQRANRELPGLHLGPAWSRRIRRAPPTNRESPSPITPTTAWRSWTSTVSTGQSSSAGRSASTSHSRRPCATRSAIAGILAVAGVPGGDVRSPAAPAATECFVRAPVAWDPT